MVRALLEAGADVNKSITGGNGHTPLTMASSLGKVEVVRVLLEAGADVNKSATDGDGHTPLTAASMHGRVEACLLYTSPSPRDKRQSRMPSSA